MRRAVERIAPIDRGSDGECDGDEKANPDESERDARATARSELRELEMRGQYRATTTPDAPER